jgi:hypothetical protein
MREDDLHCRDSAENIQKCLNCTRGRCTNCLGPHGNPDVTKRCKIDKQKFIELYELGLTDVEIGEHFGMDKCLTRYYRLKFGLPSKIGRGGRRNVRA